MEGLRTYPFCEDEDLRHWRLNEANPVVQKMLSDDDEDSEGLGDVGSMSGRLASEAPFWRLVCCLRLPLAEVDSWTLGEMRLASAFLEMQGDYKRIWNPYFEMKRESASEA